MEQFSQNPFRPGVTHSVFNPDQLISGPLQVVTDTSIIAKAGILKRGTILGKVTDSGEYALSKKGAADGSEIPCAILADDVDTTDSSVSGGVYLMGEFNQNRIIHDESWTAAELKDALRKFSVFLRDSVQA
ncbi:head decoration protein [Morganella morganii]|uniref:head decoration protein n=1 Tax=Morganella morganii TaxID=582 RepID=UPI000DCBF0F5|nr:head decoration protein [Morganella morganii]TFQ21759.1 head decoration protein [Escherichia coli]MBC4001175.1 head decoration protein [Morganella morganii]MBT0411992.1 head decoration protein [Morganella morganii subsp. morganii]MBV0430653.1 head decoration protein [Morganella morganii subsp. morganii]RAX24897.1 head decoration protein [Morganella morganii]